MVGSQADLARLLGMDPSEISKMVKRKDKRIHRNKRSKKIDLTRTYENFQKNPPETKHHIKQKEGAAKLRLEKIKKLKELNPNVKDEVPPSLPTFSESLASVLSNPAMDELRTKEEQLKLDKLIEEKRKLRLKNDQMEGKLIDYDETESFIFELARSIRDSFLDSRSRIASLCADLTNPSEIDALLNKEFIAVLQNITDDLIKFKLDKIKENVKNYR